MKDESGLKAALNAQRRGRRGRRGNPEKRNTQHAAWRLVAAEAHVCEANVMPEPKTRREKGLVGHSDFSFTVYFLI
jgi:hypothetical protein